jgi:hypothetical protein
MHPFRAASAYPWVQSPGPGESGSEGGIEDVWRDHINFGARLASCSSRLRFSTETASACGRSLNPAVGMGPVAADRPRHPQLPAGRSQPVQRRLITVFELTEEGVVLVVGQKDSVSFERCLFASVRLLHTRHYIAGGAVFAGPGANISWARGWYSNVHPRVFMVPRLFGGRLQGFDIQS